MSKLYANILALFEPSSHLNLLPENRKDFAVTALAAVIGAVAHSIFLALFLAFEVSFMVYFNVGSILIFISMFFLNRYTVGNWGALVNLASLEVIVHAICAVVILGWDSNFHLYLFAPVLLLFLILRRSIFNLSVLVFAGSSVASYITLALYTHYHLPLQVISDVGMDIFSVMNIVNVMFILVIITAYYNYAANKAAQEVAVKNEELMSLNEELLQQADMLQIQTQELELANQYTNDSIQYALRIQQATLPSETGLSRLFGQDRVMVLYKPKDVISGDFYWVGEKNALKIIVVADCTGHGVPGAMLTMIGRSLLNHIIMEKGITAPNLILDALQAYFSDLFSDTHNIRDGMDVGVVCIDVETKRLYFAGARIPLTYLQNEQIHTIRGDKMAIGDAGGKLTTVDKFTTHQVDIAEPTMLYLYTDGYQDQFGGPKDQKFYATQLKDLFVQLHKKPVDQQYTELYAIFEHWKRGNTQTDDVTILGIRVG
jgi:serine phosphatase RsbU (regulator of sigma subunit)